MASAAGRHGVALLQAYGSWQRLSPAGMGCAQVSIVRAENDVYAAEVDGSLLLKLGIGSIPVDEATWSLAESGHNWGVWLRR